MPSSNVKARRRRRTAWSALFFAGASLLVACGGGGSSGPSPSSAIPNAEPTLSPPLPEATTLVEGDFRVEGVPVAPYAAIDTTVRSWMTTVGARAAQVAVARNGQLIFSHAYTLSADPAYPTTQTSNLMRLASISKLAATVTINQLIAKGVVSSSTPVFPYLGIRQPLLAASPDPRSDTITVAELIDHTAGFTGSASPNDPLFTMREIELQLGLQPLTKMQFAQYVYGLPLNSNPGTTSVYDNVGYMLLGMVVEKATGLPFDRYLQANVMAPLGIASFVPTHTSAALRDPREVIPDDRLVGASVFDLSANPVQLPWSFGGGDVIFEVADSAIGYAATAENIAHLINTYDVYYSSGQPVGRNPGYARDGCLPGVESWAESRTDGVDWAANFNTRPPCLAFDSSVIASIDAELSTALHGNAHAVRRPTTVDESAGPRP